VSVAAIRRRRLDLYRKQLDWKQLDLAEPSRRSQRRGQPRLVVQTRKRYGFVSKRYAIEERLSSGGIQQTYYKSEDEARAELRRRGATRAARQPAAPPSVPILGGVRETR
jgi:hypothetical protein